jgi:hypothetical protein
MRTRRSSDFIWGAQAASLQFAAACREHLSISQLTRSLRSPAFNIDLYL